MVDIQSPTAEIRRGNKKERKKETGWKYIWSALLHRATIKNRCVTSITFGMGIALEKNRTVCIELLSTSLKRNLYLPGGVKSMAMSVYVCLFVSQKQHVQTSRKYLSLHVTCGRGSVLLWQQCNTLCTSGFADVASTCHSPLWMRSSAACTVEALRIVPSTAPAADERWRGRSLLFPIALFTILSSRVDRHRFKVTALPGAYPRGINGFIFPIDKIGFNSWCRICC